MSDSIHTRIVRVAQIAQRTARSSEDHDVAVALLDELKAVEVVASSPTEKEAPAPADQAEKPKARRAAK